MNNRIIDISTIKTFLPIMFGYLGIGAAFGIMARTAGLNLTVIMMISAFVYAGSVQFALITMLTAGTPILTILISVFLINSRIILMSLTTANLLKDETLLKKITVGSLLTDETFAISLNQTFIGNKPITAEWLNKINVSAYVTWLIATLIGGIAGGLLENAEELGLNFSITAMFIGLLWLQVVSDKNHRRIYQVSIIVATLLCFYFGLIFIPKNILILVVPIVISYLGAQFEK